MSNRHDDFDIKILAHSSTLQVGWILAIITSLVYELVNEFHATDLIVHIMFLITGIYFIRKTVETFQRHRDLDKERIKQLKESELRYSQLFNHMNVGFAVHEIILNEAGKPCDYRFLEVNKAFEQMTGLYAEHLTGKTVLEVIPELEYSWIEKYGTVALGGKPIQFEDYSKDLNCWYSVSAYSPKPGYFAVLIQDVTERDKTAESLREYQYVIENSHDMIISMDSQYCYQMANKQYLEYRGVTLDDVLGKTPKQLLGDNVYDTTIKPNLERAFAGETVKFVLDFLTLSGDERKLEVTYQPMVTDEGLVKRVFGFLIDITEKLELEEQLRQSQRIESIGTLAGGVAHDFNNILTIIMGSATYLQMSLEGNEELEPFASQIVSSSERAANLTQSLLAFSRKQTIQVELLDLNSIVDTIHDFLGGILGENLHIDSETSSEPQIVCADRNQIEQVLMNLVVNARDAMMPKGGNIVVRTSSVDYGAVPELETCKPGKYVLLSVSDTGHGMTDKVRERIFEPFFTTKDVGQGTGLGLSVAYGIVAQHEGGITVESEPGKGSTFKVFLPIANKQCSLAEHELVEEPPRGEETILLVEDNDDVRFINRIILQNNGYIVLEASNAEEALHVLHHQGSNVALAIMDVLMPGMNGKELADLCTSFLPDLRVLFVTGYGAAALGKKGIVMEQVNLLHKPLNVNNFLLKVREVLDSEVYHINMPSQGTSTCP